VLPLMLPAVLLLPALVLLPTPALAPADGLVVEGAVLVDGLVLCGAVLPMVELLLDGGVEVPVVELVLPATLPVLEPVVDPVALVSLWGIAVPLDPDCGVELALPAALLFSPLALGVVAAPALVGALLWLAAELSTFSLSLTLRTPGMASATCTARLRSSSEATLPFSLTSPLFLTLTLTLENAGSVAN
jgi:hypothetical protein